MTYATSPNDFDPHEGMGVVAWLFAAVGFLVVLSVVAAFHR